MIAGPLLPDVGLASLARELLAEVDRRRRLIITAHAFAPRPRRSCDSLAAELGISRERVRQLEADALLRLAKAAAADRYARLRWRAASASRPGADTLQAIDDAAPWMEGLLRWLPEHTGQR
ncbi:MAG: sigma factor-like helix-turn-helix DNA-binding protein [Streptosporangiales bacterium]